jgi:hypothetical protein
MGAWPTPSEPGTDGTPREARLRGPGCRPATGVTVFGESH